MDFRWNEWNIEHVAQHGVSPEAAEEVLQAASGSYPRGIGGGKLLVWGKSEEGCLHARRLTERESRRFRRQQR